MSTPADDYHDQMRSKDFVPYGHDEIDWREANRLVEAEIERKAARRRTIACAISAVGALLAIGAGIASVSSRFHEVHNEMVEMYDRTVTDVMAFDEELQRQHARLDEMNETLKALAEKQRLGR